MYTALLSSSLMTTNLSNFSSRLGLSVSALDIVVWWRHLYYLFIGNTRARPLIPNRNIESKLDPFRSISLFYIILGFVFFFFLFWWFTWPEIEGVLHLSNGRKRNWCYWYLYIMWCAPLLQKALFEPISVQKRHTKAENDTVDILGLNWKQPKIEVESFFLSQGEYAGE